MQSYHKSHNVVSQYPHKVWINLKALCQLVKYLIISDAPFLAAMARVTPLESSCLTEGNKESVKTAPMLTLTKKIFVSKRTRKYFTNADPDICKHCPRKV